MIVDVTMWGGRALGAGYLPSLASGSSNLAFLARRVDALGVFKLRLLGCAWIFACTWVDRLIGEPLDLNKVGAAALHALAALLIYSSSLYAGAYIATGAPLEEVMPFCIGLFLIAQKGADRSRFSGNYLASTQSWVSQTLRCRITGRLGALQ